MSRSVLVLLVFMALVLAACSGGGGQTASAGAGNATTGKALFEQKSIGKDNLPGCVTCHSTQKDVTLVGPSLAGIAEDGAATVKEADYKGTAKDGGLVEGIHRVSQHGRP